MQAPRKPDPFLPHGGYRKLRSYKVAQDRVADSPPASQGKVRLSGLLGLSEFVERAAPELAANAMLCVVNQAAYLLKRQLESQGQAFWGCSAYSQCMGARALGTSG